MSMIGALRFASCTNRIHQLVVTNSRSITTTCTKLRAAEQPAKEDSMAHLKAGLTDHKINAYERRLLVWTGKYKSLDDVPERVRSDVLEKARNKSRIIINLTIMFFTFCGCAIFINSGKKARQRGESVQQMNLEWHAKMNKEAEEREKKAHSS